MRCRRTNCIFAAREKPVFRMVSDIQKKGQGIAVERLEPREKIKTSHLLTLLPEKSCKETFLDAVTSRILVVWFSTSISLVPFLLPSFLHYVSMSQVKRNTHKHTIWCRHTSSRSWRYKYNITTTIHDRTSFPTRYRQNNHDRLIFAKPHTSQLPSVRDKGTVMSVFD